MFLQQRGTNKDMKLILGVANVSFLHSISSPKAISAAELAQAKNAIKRIYFIFHLIVKSYILTERSG